MPASQSSAARLRRNWRMDPDTKHRNRVACYHALEVAPYNLQYVVGLYVGGLTELEYADDLSVNRIR